jgi:hypothetical protein
MDDLDEPFDQLRPSIRRCEVLPVDIKTKPLEPPERLTKEEKPFGAKLAVKAGWFAGCENLLEVYVRAISVERQLAGLLRQTDPADETFPERVRMHRSQMLAVGHLSGRLRLTVRSTKARDAVRGTVRGPKPWEFMPAVSDDDASSGTSSPVEPS